MHIYGIAIKSAKRGPMKEVDLREISVSSGLEGDFRGRGGVFRKRQVTIISLQQWHDACTAAGMDLPWYTRRAGLCIDGVTFGPSDVGRKITIGGNVVLEVTGETGPCKRMDEARQGLRAALTPDWRGGITCRVVKGGIVQKNSPVSFL